MPSSTVPPPAAAASAAGAAPVDPLLKATRALALGCIAALIVLGLGWELWWAPTGRGTLALKVLPLALPIAGLLRYRLYTYRWLSLLVWIYFTEGVVRAMGDPPPGRWLAAAEIVLCVLLFAACAAHVRWRFRGAVE